MYNFIKTQYLSGKIDVEKVLSYAPKWISTEEAVEIVALTL